MKTATQSRTGSETDVPHVLYMIDQLADFSGAERVLLKMIRLMPKDRYQCGLVTFRPDPSPFALRLLPCPLHIFPMRRTYDWNAVKTAVKLRRVIRAQRIQIVHTFFETSDLWGGLVAKLSGVPVLISSRRDMGILRGPRHRAAYRLVNPLFDAVLAVSERVREYTILQDRLNPSKVLTLYNGLEVGNGFYRCESTTCRRELGLEEASHIVLTVANLHRVKGVDVFIRTAAAVHRQFPRAVFLVAGEAAEPEYLQELQRLAGELGIADAVRFLGGRDDVPSLLDVADVFCLLSRSEGFSNALIEAMASSLPCVATEVGGNGEAIESGQNGFLVPVEESGAAADCIVALLGDAGLRKSLGQTARATVEAKFTARAMVNRLMEIYDRLLSLKYT